MKLKIMVLALVVLTACNSEPAVDKNSLFSSKDIESAMTAIKSEKKVLGVYHDENLAIQWTIGVKDDGSRRYGYAGYICDLLKENNVANENTAVRIVDYYRFQYGDEINPREASLGTVFCANYRRKYP